MEAVSRFLVRHRLASFLIAAPGLLLIADEIRQQVKDEPQIDVLTLAVLLAIVYVVLASIALPRWWVHPSTRTLAAWALGVAPAMFGFAAALTGSYLVVMWLCVVVSIGLIARAVVTSTWPAPG